MLKMLAFQFMIMALCAAAIAEAAGSSSTCAQPTTVGEILTHYTTVLIRTIEVAVRGFLLGYGLTIMNDLLVKGNRGDEDIAAAHRYGRNVGLGMACTMVGATVMLPTKLQDWFMDFE